MASITYGQSELVGGITSYGGRVPTARPRTGCSNDPVKVLVRSGASGRYFDDTIIARFRSRFEECKALDLTNGGNASELVM